jgi:transposase
LEPKTETIALDVGIESFPALSNGEKIENPRFFKKGEKALAKAQRKSMNGSEIRERIFAISTLKKIVDQYQFLTHQAVEAGRKWELVNPAYTSQICS